MLRTELENIIGRKIKSYEKFVTIYVLDSYTVHYIQDVRNTITAGDTLNDIFNTCPSIPAIKTFEDYAEATDYLYEYYPYGEVEYSETDKTTRVTEYFLTEVRMRRVSSKRFEIDDFEIIDYSCLED